MKNDSGALGNGLGDYTEDGGVGTVDMFGLDEFGEPAGGDSMWGAVIGGGVATGAAIITRAMTSPTSTMHRFAEAAGLVAGGLAGGVLLAFPNSRRMGWAAIATAVVTNGLRQLEASLFPAQLTIGQAQAVAAAAAASPTGTAPVSTADGTVPAGTPGASTPSGWGGVVIDPTAVIQPGNGFGIHAIEPGYAVHGGFGAPVIDRAYPVPGSVHGNGLGAARPELVGPPTLVGAGDYGMGDNPGVTQTKILGGPSVSALGTHFGATLFGGQN